MAALNVRGSLSAAILAAIGASLCCVGPLALLTLGIGGAWIANLTALEPYRPVFVGLTLLFIGLAFRSLYLVPTVCSADKACAESLTRRRWRIVFWAASVVMLGLLAVPWLAPLFY